MARPALAPVRDLVALEPHNPRSIVYQAQRLAEHVTALPTLHGDGMPEAPQRLAAMLAARLAPLTGDILCMADLADAESRLLDLSDAIGQRYFLQRRKERSEGVSLLS